VSAPLSNLAKRPGVRQSSGAFGINGRADEHRAKCSTQHDSAGPAEGL